MEYRFSGTLVWLPVYGDDWPGLDGASFVWKIVADTTPDDWRTTTDSSDFDETFYYAVANIFLSGTRAGVYDGWTGWKGPTPEFRGDVHVTLRRNENDVMSCFVMPYDIFKQGDYAWIVSIINAPNQSWFPSDPPFPLPADIFPEGYSLETPRWRWEDLFGSEGEAQYEVILTAAQAIPHESFPITEPNEILESIDAWVDAGSLEGDGPGNSGANRLNAIENMIEAAGDLIEAGAIGQACDQLMDAYLRCDGEPTPPDFVMGPASDDVAELILQLMTDHGCFF